VRALPGALVVAGPGGVLARFTDGRKQVLEPEPAVALATSGARVYWHVNGVVRSSVLELPASDPARRSPLARTSGGCRPKPGARLLLREYSVVLSRAAGATWACRLESGKTRRVASGALTDFAVLSHREVAYARPGFVGVFDIIAATRRELSSDGGPLAVTPVALIAAGPAGLSSWGYRQKAATLVSAEPATEVAIGDSETERFAYWIDAAGTPRATLIFSHP
jgi:hypothetical protein